MSYQGSYQAGGVSGGTGHLWPGSGSGYQRPGFQTDQYDPYWQHRAQPPQPSSGQDRPAPLWRRVVARLIDVAVAVPLSFVFVLPVAVVMFPIYIWLERGGSAWEATLDIGAWACIFLAFVAIEWLLLVRRDGQTLGKGLMGLRVIRDDKRAEVLPWGSGFLRMLVLIGLNYSPAAVIAWPANLLVAVCNPRRKMLHDFAAGTRVVVAPKRPVDLKADFMMAMPTPTKVSLQKRM